MMKRGFSDFFYIFKCSMLILSAIIGAGLASGQEVVVFFAQYGFVSTFFLIILFFLFFYGIKLLLKFGQKDYTIDFIKKDKFFILLDFFSVLIFITIGSAMLACLNTLLNEVIYPFSFPVWSLIAILISSLVVYLGIRALLNLTAYLMPFVILGIIYVCIKATTITTLSPPAFSTDLSNVLILFLSAISYGCCNLVVSNKLIFGMGKKLGNKQIKWVSLIVSLSMVILIGTMIISMLINDSMVLYIDLPMISMAFMISNGVGYFFSAIMFFSIITTLFTTQFSFHEIVRIKNRRIVFCLSILSFFILSLIGFNEIVKYIYPIIGGLGFIMLFYIRGLSPKPSFNSADDKIHSPR